MDVQFFCCLRPLSAVLCRLSLARPLSSRVSRFSSFSPLSAVLGFLLFFSFPLACVAAAELRGPLPILSVPYHADGALDVETLIREARFVADAGVGGFIWCQSNDAIDLLTEDEKKASFAALASAFAGVDVFVVLGCQGRDTAAMVALATEVERLAAAHPTTRLAIACRPPHDARTQDDLERYYRRLAEIARRPVIVQTYCSDKVPVPSSDLLIRLARDYPGVYGWIKEETGGADANARFRRECRAPEVKTVFSAWGSYGWLDQYRRFGTRGVISERAAYADLLMAIWSALEAGDAARADDLFATYLLMMNLRETIPGGHLRGFNLYVLKKRGIFKNFVSRDYLSDGDTSGKWKLDVRTFTPDEVAAIEARFATLQRLLRSDEKMPVAKGDDFGDVVTDTVDDAVVADARLADIGAAEFGDNPSREGELFEVGGHLEDGIFPFPRGCPVAGLFGDQPDNCGTTKVAALRPANHRPSSFMRRSRSAWALRTSSSCVENRPASSSASAAQTSSTSSSVSRMASKSVTSRMTLDATPFWVMRSGRWVFEFRAKQDAMFFRNVERGTTSSASRMVFIVRSSTGIGYSFSWVC